MKIRLSLQNAIFIHNLYRTDNARTQVIEYLLLDYFKNPGNFMLYLPSGFEEIIDYPLLNPVIKNVGINATNARYMAPIKVSLDSTLSI